MKKSIAFFAMTLSISIQFPNGARAESVVITRISANASGAEGVLLIEHAAVINCATPPSVDTGKTRCDFQIRTKLESGSLGSLLNIDPVDQNGNKLGYLATSIMYPDGNWKPMVVSVSVDKSTKITFVIKPGPLATPIATSAAYSSFFFSGANVKPFSLAPNFSKPVLTSQGGNVSLGNTQFPAAIQNAIEAVDMGWGTAIAKNAPVMLFAYPTSMKLVSKCQVVPFKATPLNPSTMQPISTKYAVFEAEIWSRDGQLLAKNTLGTSTNPWSKVSSVSTLSVKFCGKSRSDSKSVIVIIKAGQSLVGSYLIKEYQSTLSFK